MSVNKYGGEKGTFGSVSEEGLFTGALPAKSSAKQITIDERSEIFIRTFSNNAVFTFASSQTQANTNFAADDFGKILAGEGITIPVAGRTGTLFVGAETGGPHAGDLVVIEVEVR